MRRQALSTSRSWARALLVALLALSYGLSAEPLLQAESCWGAEDRAAEAFAALDREYKFSLRSSLDCAPVADAAVSIGATSARSDASGVVSFGPEAFGDAIDDAVTISVSKEGYIAYEAQVRVFFREPLISDTFVLLSPLLPPGSARVILTWYDKPRDLDLHLYGPGGMHVYYRERQAGSGSAAYGRDDRHSFGNEVITLTSIVPNAEYRFYAHNYSNDAEIRNARVQIYSNNTLLRNLQLFPTDQRAVYLARLSAGRWSFPNIPRARLP